MPFLRRRGLSGRILIAIFALWIPAAAGDGGRATNIAVSEFAKLHAVGGRVHLPCHGDSGSPDRKDCCCKKESKVEAGECGCHDGGPASGGAAADPMIEADDALVVAMLADRSTALPRVESSRGRSEEPPDAPPPESFSHCQA